MFRPPGSAGRGIRLAGRLAAVAAVAAAAILAAASPSQAAGPLRNVSGSRFIGYAANADLLCSNSAACTSGSNPTYRGIANSEFNQVTAENAMKWEATQPNPGQFTF